ncbi:MAG: protein kinase domain-containing protein [Actinomycetota bacterium]
MLVTTADLLAPGTLVDPVNTSLVCRVQQCLGEGSQGAVFSVLAEDGKIYALKWYHPVAATEEQWEALTQLLDRDPPHERFLWPIDLARVTGKPGFGYLMPLRKHGFVGMADLVANRVDVSFREAATIGLELAESFLFLHSRGLCYRDINFGNVFLDPKRGSVLVCDVDNVGINDRSSSQVLGTPYFMAPEILRGEVDPNTRTDQFSLAVLLFFLLVGHHPLEGRKALNFEVWNAGAQLEVFGRNPLFIFDDEDNSNRPVPGYQDTPLALWPVYPQFLRDLFQKSFTVGLWDPANGRVVDSVWRSAMVRLRDSIVYCQACGKQNFYDAYSPGLNCWSCRTEIKLPFRIRIAPIGGGGQGAREVMLNKDTSLYAHHLRLDYDFTTEVARVVRHPRNPKILGLHNLMDRLWIARQPDGSEHKGFPGGALKLIEGIKVQIGPVEAEILSPDHEIPLPGE